MLILTPRADYKFWGRDMNDDPSDAKNLDWKVIKETWVENVYHLEPDMFGNKEPVFVDIGANIGSVSLYVDSFNHDREGKPNIITYAVEPEPNNLKLLHQNIAENPTKQIIVIEKAIWHEPGLVNISDQGGNSNIISSSDTDPRVEAISLEKLFKDNYIDRVNALKMDVENAEMDILLNTPDEVLAKINFLALEFDINNDGRFGQVVDKLARQFGIQILGSPARGGYVYARLY